MWERTPAAKNSSSSYFHPSVKVEATELTSPTPPSDLRLSAAAEMPDSNQNFFSNFFNKHSGNANNSAAFLHAVKQHQQLPSPLAVSHSGHHSDRPRKISSPLTDQAANSAPVQLFPNVIVGDSNDMLQQQQRPLSPFFSAASHHPHLPAFLRERLRAAAESFHHHHPFYSHPFLHPSPESQLPFLPARQQHPYSQNSLLRMREEAVSCGPSAAINTAPQLSESLINRDS